MEQVVTVPAGETPSALTDVVSGVTSPSSRSRSRRQHILELREAIERGEYRVSAADLADAMIRAVRRAN